MKLRLFAAVLVVALLAAAPNRAAASESAPAFLPPASDQPTPLLVLAGEREDRMTVTLATGASGSAEFLVDTGAEWSVVSSALAARLGLAPAGTVAVHGVGGRIDVPFVELGPMALGSLRFASRRALVMDERDIGASGILGIDALRDQRLTLDFAAQRISIAPSRSSLPRRSGGETHDALVRAKEQGRRLFIRDARVDGTAVVMIVDTGLNFSIGNAALRRVLEARARRAMDARMRDAVGNILPARILQVRSLEIDTVRFPNPSIAFVDTRVFDEIGLGGRPALLLGMNHLRMFGQVSVDFRRKHIAFDLRDEPHLPRTNATPPRP